MQTVTVEDEGNERNGRQKAERDQTKKPCASATILLRSTAVQARLMHSMLISSHTCYVLRSTLKASRDRGQYDCKCY
jgi:hypothetical protein